VTQETVVRPSTAGGVVQAVLGVQTRRRPGVLPLPRQVPVRYIIDADTTQEEGVARTVEDGAPTLTDADVAGRPPGAVAPAPMCERGWL
jgi:hypothetical protein